METQHTSGPWEVVWLPQSCSAEIETVTKKSGDYRHMTNQMPMCAGIGIETVMIVDEDDPDRREYRYSAEAVANAHLIAAAPDLLEALRICSDLSDEFSEVCSVAKAAIAKAQIANK